MDWGLVFPERNPIEVELGSGDGGFILELAQRSPHTNFLAVERLMGRARKIARKISRNQLPNVAVTRLEARHTLQRLFHPGSVARVHIYFPDPWPKSRHAKNRLIQASLLDTLRRTLQPNGEVFLRTDNEPYWLQMRDVFRAATDFAPIGTPPEIAEITTAFEQGFNARGIPTRYLAFQIQAPTVS